MRTREATAVVGVDRDVSVPRPAPGRLDRDVCLAAEYFARGREALAGLPAPPERSGAHRDAAAAVHDACRRLRTDFLRVHAEALYEWLTDGLLRSVRIDELASSAAAQVPGLVPDPALIAAERRLPQRDKEGWEIDQGLFFASMLGNPRTGGHLLHAMLRPQPQACRLLSEFQATDRLDLGTVTMRRAGAAAHVTLHNPDYLNAEDDGVVAALETAVDLVLLDDRVRVGVLRGDRVEHPRYAGRRIFNAGINLTHLYQGQISFVDFLLRRELGYISKMFRGLAVDGGLPEQKAWVGAVDTFAIGGGLQLLLVLDRVIAEHGAYFTLPALREGIIPGAANLRLSRLAGDRMARQLIFAGRRIVAGEPAAGLFCDEVVGADAVDERIEVAVDDLSNPALAGNRRVLHQAEEPVDVFRQYMAQYAREQTIRLYSRDLMDNLEWRWVRRHRD